MAFTKIAPVGIGTEPGSSIRIGDSLLHSTGIDLGTGTGVGVTIRQHGDATFTGIVTASSFSGSGANLTGVASTDHIKTSTTANFTDGIQVGGGTTLTGDLSVTGNIGVGGTLTYEDVTNVDSIGIITARSAVSIADSIIHTGDTNTSLRFPAADTISAETGGNERVRIDSSGRLLYGQTSAYSVNPAGGEIIGVFAKDQANRSDFIVSNQSSANNAGAGIVLASHGQDYIIESTGSGNSTDGAGALTISKTGSERLRIASNGNIEIRKNDDAKTVLKGDSVGIGTTTTTGRNAGVSTTAGTLIFNSTSGELQVYNGTGWDVCSNIFSATGGNTTYTQGNYKVHVFTSTGDFVANGVGQVDSLVVAGGGGAGQTSRPNHNGAWTGGGGAGGVLYTENIPLSGGSHPVVIGAGGAVNSNGVNSSALGYTAIGGGRGGGSPYPSPGNGGAAGGSGGGGLGDNAPSSSRAAGAGTSGQGNPGGLGIDPGNAPDDYEQGGGGGGAGEAGNTDANGFGGDGRDMSAEFGTTYGESGVFGGGGAGGSGTSGASTNEGGLGGGGDSGHGYQSQSASQAGATNTGGGGGAGGNQPGGGGQPGGPGIVLIRYLA